jgi:hypothetical protein
VLELLDALGSWDEPGGKLIEVDEAIPVRVCLREELVGLRL